MSAARAEVTSTVVKSIPVPERTAWARYAAAGSLVASAVLLARGQRKAGLVAAAAGTALAAVDQQEGVRELWRQAPRYLALAQTALVKVEDYLSRLRESAH